MTYRTIDFTFNPFGYTTPEDVTYLSDLLHKQAVVASFPLKAHRRRNAWGSTLPVGTFDNDFRENACSWEQHTASRDRITTLAASEMTHGRRPIPRRYDVLPLDGRLYYHPEALRVYARYVPHGAFLLALARFLETAERDPSLIVPKRTAPFIPIADRAARFGRTTRGPDWTAEEDLVLRQWFGPRSVGPHTGKHVPLTDAEWEIVLKQLPRRNRNGVRNRLVELNAKLKTEYMRDGYVSHAQIAEYMSKVLGERPRIPLRSTRSRRAAGAARR